MLAYGNRHYRNPFHIVTPTLSPYSLPIVLKVVNGSFLGTGKELILSAQISLAFLHQPEAGTHGVKFPLRKP